MRGTIIMWNGEKGVVAASGVRYDFDINTWRGDTAPRANMSVELSLAEGVLVALIPVPESEQAKELLNQLAGQGAKYARSLFNTVGRNVVIAYGLFAIGALILSFISGKGMMSADAYTMPGVINGLNGGDGGGTLMILLALGSIVVPHFWKHKYASLAFCAPLLVTLYAGYHCYRVYAAAKEQLAGLGSWMGAAASKAIESQALPFDFGMGAYLAGAAAVYLAFRGVRKYLSVGRDLYGAPPATVVREAPAEMPVASEPVSVVTRCGNCGNDMGQGEKFCSACGTRQV